MRIKKTSDEKETKFHFIDLLTRNSNILLIIRDFILLMLNSKSLYFGNYEKVICITEKWIFKQKDKIPLKLLRPNSWLSDIISLSFLSQPAEASLARSSTTRVYKNIPLILRPSRKSLHNSNFEKTITTHS